VKGFRAERGDADMAEAFGHLRACARRHGLSLAEAARGIGERLDVDQILATPVAAAAASDSDGRAD